jgi:hypothetical protein
MLSGYLQQHPCGALGPTWKRSLVITKVALPLLSYVVWLGRFVGRWAIFLVFFPLGRICHPTPSFAVNPDIGFCRAAVAEEVDARLAAA